MDEKRAIIIDLDNSMYAHEFTSEQQIHQENLDKAINIIRNQIKQSEASENTDVYLNHIYRTIGVFGDRGSGKTSFMISLLNRCKNEMKDNVEVLRLIDPTLVEHKKPIILCVISMIQQKVEKKLRNIECQTNNKVYEQRKAWNNLMEKISRGIFAIDNVGEDYDSSLWQDETYVMYTGLAKVNDANAFEENLREMIKRALDILNKKTFVLAFDDIDMDIEQGWNVLESLRRYLSDTHIISIVSGNIKLYGMLVRHKLAQNLKMSEAKSRKTMSNEMESQYMLKLLNPKYRISLLTLKSLIQNNDVNVRINGETNALQNQYKCVLNNWGIIDSPSQNIFINFLLSMSLRSQIHFLYDACIEKKDNLPLDVFSSRLYALGIDMNVLEANVQMLNIIILDYLNKIKNLPDCYLLMPTLSDKDVNSNFTALTFMECWHLRTNPYLVFDYLLRIGYIRNVVLPFEEEDLTLQLCKYAGWNQQMSLKNNIGLTMAFVAGKKLGSMKEHIALYAMEEKAKKSKDTQRNALDKVLKDERDPFIRLMAMFPFVRITHNKNNESRSYYSLIVMLSVIGEVLKCVDKEEMIGRINDLKLFRSYQMPQDKDYFGEDERVGGDDYGVEINQDKIVELAGLMYRWKESYKNCHLPLYALGRIMTRLYASLLNVTMNSVGKIMNVMVANFFNACLIEETKIRIPASEQSRINNSNLRSDTRYFKDNLAKSNIVSKLKFSKWIMSCPMLNCFLDKDTCDKVKEFVPEELAQSISSNSIYELLDNIKSKDGESVEADDKPPFSGEKTEGLNRTLGIFKNNGITDNIIMEKIINEDNIEKIKKYIEALGFFGIVRISSIKSFKNNFKREEITADVERPQDSRIENRKE